jgi:HEAT repeat protein
MRTRRALPFLTSLLSIAPILQSSPPAPAPAPVGDTAPKGLIGVAKSEAERTQRQLRDQILGKLRAYATLHQTVADQGVGFVKSIVDLGADAVPVLLDCLRDAGGGKLDAAFAGPAARALAGIYDKTKNEKLLESVAEIVKSGDAGVRAAILDGLSTLDHKMVVDMVAPLLADPTAALRVLAVKVLGRQRSHPDQIGALLRPLLSQQGAPWPEAIQALDAIGDKQALEPVVALLGKCDEPAFLSAAIHYLGDQGTRTTLPALRTFLLKGPNGVADKTLEQAVDAVEHIGLRDGEARKGAEDLLVDVYKTHANAGIREHAQWHLGAFGNDEARKAWEVPLLKEIAETKKANRSTIDKQIELATVRLHYEDWKGARQALERAKDEDDKKWKETLIQELTYVAWVGDGGKKLGEAEKFLREHVSLDERATLLRDYPCLEKLQQKYPDLFPIKK